MWPKTQLKTLESIQDKLVSIAQSIEEKTVTEVKRSLLDDGQCAIQGLLAKDGTDIGRFTGSATG